MRILILAPYLAPYEVNKNFKGGYLIIDFFQDELGATKNNFVIENFIFDKIAIFTKSRIDF